MKKHAIIPVFIPHRGCPNDCVFCNQKAITARQPDVTPENVRDIIEEPLRVHTDLSAEEKLAVVRPVLEQIELPEETLEKYPHEFSGGQRQRIGIARVLVTNPELLVCDEPVSALDVSIQASILNLFKRMQRERGLSYLFISHDLSVVKHLCDRIAVMYLGRIVELADKKELFYKILSYDTNR